MEQISKPELVDFLRISDRKRWCFPRIRYASIRSKPTLLKDMRHHFRERWEGKQLLTFLPKNSLLTHVPRIQYNFAKKCFLFDGKHIDVPRASRERLKFSVSKVPVTLVF